MKKIFLSALLLSFGLASANAAEPTSKYPTKPIHLIVGFSPGGAADSVGRALAEGLSNRLGQPVVVENKAGANGNIAAEYVARSPADGYVLYFPSIGQAVNVSLYKNLSYDPIKDFTAIGGVFSAPNMLVVPMNSPYKTVAELIAAGKANPGKLTYASSGSGTSVHLSAALFEKMAKIDMVHIPYKGTGSAMPDVISGQVDMSFPNLPSAWPQVKAGNLRALGVTTAKRSAAAPNVPTIAEGGLPGYDMATWYGLVAPANLPPNIRTRLNKELQVILADPKFKDKLIAQGADPMPGTPEQFAQFIKSEIEKWRKLIAQSNITVD
ncbi:tripartite tricarboxylate transporter substrate binding protein [Polynucleobacter sp. AP-Latsch-80-C2]|jgi:tripartite-type tricarboxylate transporter receptor subunit TctC|uniref:Bug family tripartite tricarboxylate transporter substrate binding protein n=1 Tax=Polynucleobacter sp. AP-Latsch-80-C2 TaxID=2576931 RepID=UPI001C0B0740|nr:tripartite tricarboxylate transporter substrate binding protein [Polynucleobacter sp. AP-Latsch-80-C2]MBU3623110.1 tripartite tricarboxylate transporter substrate binding protein [Polynucleobacter sp. AP-Latsch-80-C2]